MLILLPIQENSPWNIPPNSITLEQELVTHLMRMSIIINIIIGIYPKCGRMNNGVSFELSGERSHHNVGSYKPDTCNNSCGYRLESTKVH